MALLYMTGQAPILTLEWKNTSEKIEAKQYTSLLTWYTSNQEEKKRRAYAPDTCEYIACGDLLKHAPAEGPNAACQN